MHGQPLMALPKYNFGAADPWDLKRSELKAAKEVLPPSDLGVWD
jgi:hypothetical protein